jgi:acyl phosphate:glycerol-3-phosphate acyltransferase
LARELSMFWVSAIAAYLIGGIPFGVIVANFYGVDLRTKGSGNIGATNALRVIGKKAGAITLACDILKGTAAVYLGVALAGRDAGLIAAAAAVAGHDFPVYTGFKGGKGVATTFGVVLALEPVIALVAVAAWVIPVAVWRYSSLGALVSFGVLPLTAYVMKAGDRWFFMLSVALTALAFFKHRSNIGRLVRGEEPRIGARTA